MFHLSISELGKTGTFLPLEVADGSRLVLERIPVHQSLHPPIAVLAAFFMYFGVLH